MRGAKLRNHLNGCKRARRDPTMSLYINFVRVVSASREEKNENLTAWEKNKERSTGWHASLAFNYKVTLKRSDKLNLLTDALKKKLHQQIINLSKLSGIPLASRTTSFIFGRFFSNS